MKQKDREIIKKIFSQISKLTYSELKSQFNKEYEEKLKIDTKSVLLLQGAGDIKNIINILHKNDTK